MNETRPRTLSPADSLSKLNTATLLAGGAPLLRADGLSKSYHMGRAPLRVIQNCTLHIRRGEFVAIMGKSGSGKSTLLHLLGAIDRPDAGEVFLNGLPLYKTQALLERFGRAAESILRSIASVFAFIARLILLPAVALCALFWVVVLIHRLFAGAWMSEPTLRTALWATAIALGAFAAFVLLWIIAHALRTLAAFLEERQRVGHRRRDFGFVFQFYHLLPELNVLENVLMTRMIGASTFAWLTGERAAARADALAILHRVGLSERLRHRPSELSGGERQRVAIARALIHKPSILFADEPTGNLDAAAGRQLMELFLGLNRDGQTVVMVTHDASVAALAHRIMRLEEGRLVDS